MVSAPHRSECEDRIPNPLRRQTLSRAPFPSRSKDRNPRQRISAESDPSQSLRKLYPKAGTSPRHWECSAAAQPSRLRESGSKLVQCESELSFLPMHSHCAGLAKEKPNKAGTPP